MTALLALVMASLASAAPLALPGTDVFDLPASPGFDLSGALPDAVQQTPPPPDLDKWKGSVSLGATVSDGNSNRKTGTGTATVERRGENDRITLNLLWNYAKESGVTTQRRTLGSAKYDYFLSKKTYLLAQASGESDLNAQLELRTIVGVGAGYQLREDERWKISGEAGLSYVDENYEDNTADQDFLAARLAYKADWKASDRWEVGQVGEVYPSLEDKEDVNARVDTHARVTLTKNMFAQLQWLFTWDNTPASGAKRVDDLYLLTVGWSF